MDKLQFNVVSDIKQARELWNTLSPRKTIDDEWDFRYQFYKYLPFKLHFIAGYHGTEPVGLLPLQFNTGEGLAPPYGDGTHFLEFFGGDDTDDNKVFLKPGYEHMESDFFDQIDRKAFLAPLQHQYIYNRRESEVYEAKYLLPLEGFTSCEDYLEKRWSGESRRKLRQQMRRIYRNHEVKTVNNAFQDIDFLAEMNKNRFGETSSFNHEYRKDIFRDLTHNYQTQTITLFVDGKKMGISYGLVYKNTYIGMNAGVDSSVRDLGKLLVLLQIKRSIELGCTMYDGGKGSGQWKTEFKFESAPQYILRMNTEEEREKRYNTDLNISFARS